LHVQPGFMSKSRGNLSAPPVEFINPVAGPGNGGDIFGVETSGLDREGVALNPRLAILLEQESKGGAMKGLERRLVRLQGSLVKEGELGKFAAEKKVSGSWRRFGMEGGGYGGNRENEQKLARERALVILQVRSGALTAKKGAQLLGVSRKTYYEWEEKFLKAMAVALENRPPGRPPASIDKERETFRERIRELKDKLDLAEKTIKVKRLLGPMKSFRIRALRKRTDRQGA